ncbi:MAG TPA: anti-sigma factor [Candidatus Dormibacteraeota bacterium]|nr:anti-sigma factor [Candidatus Dormibacteraeota bacterium]
MTHMDHAAAHERIEDLLLEPARLAGLDASTTPADVALREHVAGCAACLADLDGWRAVERSVSEALPASESAARAAVQAIEVPPSLRAATIDAIRRPQPRSIVTPLRRARERPRLVAWLGLAASIVVLAGAGLITADQINQRNDAQAEARSLTTAIAAVDRVLAEPGHRAVALKTAGGAPAGSISWSSHDLVVLTTALMTPASGQRYRCWLENGGTSVAIGWMDFAGQTAYWIRSLDEWATFQIGPSTKFVVTLEPTGSTTRTGADVLSADLGS